MKYLLEISTDDQKDIMIKMQDCESFRKAIKKVVYANHSLDGIRDLFKLVTVTQKDEVIEAKDYEVFRQSFKNDILSLDLTRYLFEISTDSQKKAMIAANDYEIFRYAVLSAPKNRIELMDFLFDALKRFPQELDAMIKADNYSVLNSALVVNGNEELIKYLLSKSLSCFDHAERNAIKNDQVHSYIDREIEFLRVKFENHPKSNKGNFNLTNVEAQHYFYILRNLIRRNDPNVLNDVRFLLNIPEIKTCAAIQYDEIFKLVTQDDPIVKLLMDLVEVKESALPQSSSSIILKAIEGTNIQPTSLGQQMGTNQSQEQIQPSPTQDQSQPSPTQHQSQSSPTQDQSQPNPNSRSNTA